MRIIAGQYRRRSLQSRPGLDLRPTSDRLRETLFDVLAAVGSLSDSVWVDLYAGTEAVGVEALSRGAHQVKGSLDNPIQTGFLIQRELAH